MEAASRDRCVRGSGPAAKGRRLTGRETFRAAREILPDLPFLFCSGYAPESLLASIQSAEHTGRLAKPFSAEELQAAVRGLLVAPTA
jgi:CheY-like chemotaxis protein